MLQLILGVSGTGKTTQVLEQMKLRAKAGSKSLLLVPEQFTSSAETMVYTALGDLLCAHAGVYSFTSYAEAVLKACGGVAAHTLTDAGRVVVIRRAMDKLGDALQSYHRHRRNTGFCSMCADAVKELKTAGATPETLLAVASAMGADGEKLHELGLIFGAYEGLLQGVAMDPSDRIATAAQRITDDFFAGQAVFIDNFEGFTAPEYAMLRRLMQAECCTVTLCCNQLADHENGLGLFSPVQHTALRLRRLAAQQGMEVAAPQVLTQDLRHKTEGLRAVNGVLCGAQPQAPQHDGVFFTEALSVYDECKTVAAQMVRLAAAGTPYGKMAVICRLMDAYAAPLQYELGLAGIPYFTDETTTLEHSAPAAFFRAALGLLARGVSGEGVLRLLKTDLCGFSEGALGALENYVYTWQPRTVEWREPFTKNPAGFGAQPQPEDVAALAAAEQVRSEAMPKIDAFLDAARGAGAAELSRQLYLLLAAFGGDAHTQAASDALRAQGQAQHADAVLRAYNTMMEFLNQLAVLLDGDEVSAAEYDDMLVLLLRASDIGHVPQTQNAVILTTADRMRLSAPTHCFVLGLAEGEFPKAAGYSGLLTHTDRELLVENGVEMPGSYENRTLLEQMFFYRALTAPSQGLYLSAVSQQAGGAPVSSALVTVLEALCPPALALSVADRAPTPAAALDLLGAQYRDDTPETAALAEVLKDEPSFAAMQNAASPLPFAAHDTAALRQLLGERMALSPTRIEQYYRCRFGYFLQYVLGLRPCRRAEISPLESGSLVHYILEQVLRRAGAEFSALSPEELVRLASEVADAYVAENMPGAGVRFAYLIDRLKSGTVRLLRFLQQEQAQSAFHPVAFEQDIGFGEGAVRPLTMQAPGGQTVQIIGKIDRVDIMEREGHSYLRVVDYKTGDKEFRLDEVYCGLNTQMLFYLFTLCKNAGDVYKNPVAAGVLYVAGDPAPKVALRDEAKKPPAYRMDGMVLYDELVMHGMDKEATGLFVPFSYTTTGAPRASAKLASLEKLGRIEQHIERLACEMAQGLYDGSIGAEPLCTAKHVPCDVCQYRPVCRHETGVGEKTVQAPKDVFGEGGSAQ